MTGREAGRTTGFTERPAAFWTTNLYYTARARSDSNLTLAGLTIRLLASNGPGPKVLDNRRCDWGDEVLVNGRSSPKTGKLRPVGNPQSRAVRLNFGFPSGNLAEFRLGGGSFPQEFPADVQLTIVPAVGQKHALRNEPSLSRSVLEFVTAPSASPRAPALTHPPEKGLQAASSPCLGPTGRQLRRAR